jgi:hypothetical protein
MQGLVGHEAHAHLLGWIEIAKVALAWAEAARRLARIEDAKAQERLGGGASRAKAAADVAARGENECVTSEDSIAGSSCNDSIAIHI